MKFLVAFHISAGVLGAIALCYFATFREAESFAVGAMVSALNLVTLVYSWPRILAKKQVALSVGVIVFKFAILGWIIYVVATSQVFHLGWVAAGLALVIPSVLATSLKFSQNTSEKAES